MRQNHAERSAAEVISVRMTRLAVVLLLAACAAGNLYGGIIANAFPIIGEGLGQTLRVIAVAPEGGAGCDAMLGFVDVSGNQQPPNPNKTVDLMPGQSDFLNFPANLVLTRLGQRLELRPTADVMAMLPSGAPANTDCMFFAKVFDQASHGLQPGLRSSPQSQHARQHAHVSTDGRGAWASTAVHGCGGRPRPTDNPSGRWRLHGNVGF